MSNFSKSGVEMNELNLVSICDGANTCGYVAKKIGLNHTHLIDKTPGISRITTAKVIELLEDWRIINDKIDVAYLRTPRLQLSTHRSSDYDHFFFKEILSFMDIKKPKWVIWEAHPRLIQANGGRQFREIIGGITSIGYGVSWRVFDSSLFKSPIQSDKLILACCFNEWEPTRDILFEEESSIGAFEFKDKARKGSKLSTLPEDKRAIEVTPEMILLANNLPPSHISKIPKDQRMMVAKNASNALLVEFLLSRIQELVITDIENSSLS